MRPTKRRLLCAEANKDICSLISMLLEREGHEVVFAETVAECIEQAGRQHFDLYMLDDRYADGTSLELCKRLRELDRTTPILFFSSAAFERDRQRGMDAGAQAYLTKPGDILKIAQTVNAILSGSTTEFNNSKQH